MRLLVPVSMQCKSLGLNNKPWLNLLQSAQAGGLASILVMLYLMTLSETQAGNQEVMLKDNKACLLAAGSARRAGAVPDQ